MQGFRPAETRAGGAGAAARLPPAGSQRGTAFLAQSRPALSVHHRDCGGSCCRPAGWVTIPLRHASRPRPPASVWPAEGAAVQLFQLPKAGPTSASEMICVSKWSVPVQSDGPRGSAREFLFSLTLSFKQGCGKLEMSPLSSERVSDGAGVPFPKSICLVTQPLLFVSLTFPSWDLGWPQLRAGGSALPIRGPGFQRSLHLQVAL